MSVLAQLILSLCALSAAVLSDPVPGAEQTHPIALVGGDVYTVSGDVLHDATLIFDKGVITAVGRGIKVPEGAEIIAIRGKSVYPSLIACGTQMGLIEIGAVRATNDQAEVGELNPNARAEVSVNPDSELIPVTRSNGVGIVETAPKGGLLSGRSALIRLDGWTWEQLVVEAPLGIHINWPRMGQSGGRGWRMRGRRGGGGGGGNERRDRQLAKLDDFIVHAKAYARKKQEEPDLTIDLRFESMLPVVRGECPVFLHANSERDIREAMAWANRHSLKAVIVGGSEAAQCAEELAAAKVPVIYGAVHRLPRRRDADFDEPYAVPAALSRVGVQFAIASFETDNARNLPYQAATAAAYGLDPKEALRAITLYPAQILGVADRLGSIEVGKSASIFVTDGDPLEITTQVESLWLDGRRVDLENRQTRLYEKYSERLRRIMGAERF